MFVHYMYIIIFKNVSSYQVWSKIFPSAKIPHISYITTLQYGLSKYSYGLPGFSLSTLTPVKYPFYIIYI